jgi:single-stranded DNA-binding protein
MSKLGRNSGLRVAPFSTPLARSGSPCYAPSASQQAPVREVFGNIRLLRGETPGSLLIEAEGLAIPAVLEPLGADGVTPITPLEALVGKVIQFNGVLAPIPGTVGVLRVQATDVQQPPTEITLSPLWCAVVGNIGSDAQPGRRKDRITASLCFHSRTNRTSNGNGVETDTSSWLRIQAQEASAFAPVLARQTKGTRLLACGNLESYTYRGENGEERHGAHLELRALGEIPSSAPAPNQSVFQARPATEAIPAGAEAEF